MKIFGNRKVKGAKKSKKLPIALTIVILVLGTIVVVPKALWNFWVWDLIPSKPDPVKPPQSTPFPVDGIGTQDDSEDNPEAAMGTQPPLPEGNYKEDFFTIILAGTDEDDYRTDVLMVASFDAVNKKVNVVSIPRDTMVNAKRVTKKINAAYGIGKNSTSDKSAQVEKGAAQLKKELRTIIGFEPSHYIFIKYEGFKNLVDKIGGVYYDVPVNMKDQWDTFNIKKGPQLLLGQDALDLCRYRGYNDADLGRIAQVQSFLKVVYKQTLEKTGITDMPSLIDIFVDNVSTDLKPGHLIWFAQEIAAIEGGVDGENIKFYQIPITFSSQLYKGQSYVYIDKTPALKMINETINPYNTSITSKNVDIIKLTGSGASSSASSSSGSRQTRTTPKPRPSSRPENRSESTPKPNATPRTDSTPKPSSRPADNSVQDDTGTSEPPENTAVPDNPPVSVATPEPESGGNSGESGVSPESGNHTPKPQPSSAPFDELVPQPETDAA